MILTIFTISFCWLVLALAGYTMWKLTWFLSDHQGQREIVTQSFEDLGFSLGLDFALLLAFMLQHSCWKTMDIGNYLSKYKISRTIARSIYVMLTCLVLQVFYCKRKYYIDFTHLLLGTNCVLDSNYRIQTVEH